MHRNILISEVLKGSREAIQLLADLIEEEGDTALAERTRARKQHDRKLLKLALELCTYRAAMSVTIDFFEHALSFGRRRRREIRDGLQSLREWTQMPGPSSDFEFDLDWDDDNDGASEIDESKSVSPERATSLLRLHSARDQLRTDAPQVSPSYHGAPASCAHELAAAVDVLELLLNAELAGDHRTQRKKNNNLRNRLTQVAFNLQLLPGGLARETVQQQFEETGVWNRLPYYSEQLKWQLTHLRDTLPKLDF